jgi:hypothetical protein
VRSELASFEMLRISNDKTGQARYARVPIGRRPKVGGVLSVSVGTAKPRLERSRIWR